VSHPLALRAVELAARYIGTTEVGHNRGPLIDHWNELAGQDPRSEPAWCASFVYSMFHDAALALEMPNPCPRTASVLRLATRWPFEIASVPEPGAVFILAPSRHTGFVESVNGLLLVTVEGNTNAAGSREGNSVQRHATRQISDCRGFLILR
jgi:hypothetical protein